MALSVSALRAPFTFVTTSASTAISRPANISSAEVQVIGLVRRDVRLRTPRSNTKVLADDILILEAEPEGLSKALSQLGVTLEEHPEAEPDADEAASPDDAQEKKPSPDSDVVLIELVVTPTAPLIGRSATAIDMRTRYQINLLALSRQGKRSIGRLRDTRIEAGDVPFLGKTSSG